MCVCLCVCVCVCVCVRVPSLCDNINMWEIQVMESVFELCNLADKNPGAAVKGKHSSAGVDWPRLELQIAKRLCFLPDW